MLRSEATVSVDSSPYIEHFCAPGCKIWLSLVKCFFSSELSGRASTCAKCKYTAHHLQGLAVTCCCICIIQTVCGLIYARLRLIVHDIFYIIFVADFKYDLHRIPEEDELIITWLPVIIMANWVKMARRLV